MMSLPAYQVTKRKRYRTDSMGFFNHVEILRNSILNLQGIGILQTKSGCNLDSLTSYYHLKNQFSSTSLTEKGITSSSVERRHVIIKLRKPCIYPYKICKHFKNYSIYFDCKCIYNRLTLALITTTLLTITNFRNNIDENSKNIKLFF